MVGVLTRSKRHQISVHNPANNHVRCPYRIIEQSTGREIDWINKYLDYETLRRLADAETTTHKSQKI